MSRDYHLIQMNEKEYADYLLRQMTVDMSIEFEQTKQCSLRCLDEMLSLNSSVENNAFIHRVKAIIQSRN